MSLSMFITLLWQKNHLIILGFGRHTLNYQPPMQSHTVLHSTPFTVYHRNMQGRGRGVQQGKPPTGEGQECPAREALPWNLQLSLGNLKVSCRAHPASSPFSTSPAVLVCFHERGGGGGSSNSAKESLSSNMTRETKWTQERKREDSGYNINKTIVSDRSMAGPAEQ